MCGTSDTAEPLLAIHEARDVVDLVLDEYLRLPLAKALDFATPRGFDQAVALLAARLRRIAGPADAAAVRGAIAALDVDWTGTTAAQRRTLIARAIEAARKATKNVATAIRVPLGNAADSVVKATRTDARRRQGLAIRAEFNALDRRIARHVVSSQGNFVRDEYGRRADGFGERARGIVAAGLEQGLGRDDIASELEQAAQAAFVNRAPVYWEVVAAAFTGQARSFAQMSSYAEAGIQRYEIHAVLDEVTTPICRFLHGKTFSVGDALARFDRVEQMDRPENIKLELPWVRQAADPETGRTVLYANSASGRTAIAEVLRSGVGVRDDVGQFRAMASDAKLGEIGVGFPPFHGMCRSTTLATTTAPHNVRTSIGQGPATAGIAAR